MKIEKVLLVMIGIGLLANFVLDLHQTTIIQEQNNILGSLNEQDGRVLKLLKLLQKQDNYFIITDDVTRELKELSVKGVTSYCDQDPRAEFGICIVGENIIFREATKKILITGELQEKVK